MLNLCEQFRAEMQRGESPKLEDYKLKVDARQQGQMIRLLIAVEVEIRRNRGEHPQPENYFVRFPDLQQEIQSGFADVNVQDATLEVDPSQTRATRAVHHNNRSLRLPKQFGRYEVTKKLGQGGMGVVFQARDPDLDRLIAIKAPFLRDGDDTYLERFYREARSLASVTHPNICPVYEVGELDGVHYMAMAFIEGRTLGDYLKAGGSLGGDKVAAVMLKLAQAVSYLHSKGVVHRDMKPDNVMIDLRNEPIIMDFGLARRRQDNSRLTEPGAVVGSPAYMSPEQIEGEFDDLGPSTDVYALGVIMYKMLTGRLPFEGKGLGVLAKILNDTPPKPTALNSKIDPALESLCERAMERDPQYRPKAQEFAEMLAQYLAGETTQAIHSSATQPIKSPPKSDVKELTRDLFTELESRYQSRDRMRFVQFGLVLLLLAGLLGAGGFGVWYFSAKGRMIVQSYDPAATVTVMRGGQQIDEFQISSRPQSSAYSPGEFEVLLKDAQTSGASIRNNKFALQRGDVVIVEIIPPAERRVAIFVVEHDGRVYVRKVDESEVISQLAGLPEGRFEMSQIELQSPTDQTVKTLVADAKELPQAPDLALMGDASGVTDEGVAQMKQLPTLKGVSLGTASVTGQGVGELADLKQLERLDAGVAPVDDAALDRLSRSPNLKRLAISSDEVTTTGLESLASFPALSDFSMQGKRELTNEDAAAIGAIEQLERLSLAGTPVQDEHLKEIAKAPALRSLDLRGTGITDEGLLALKDTPLEELDVNDTAATSHGVAHLQEHSPTLAIASRFIVGGKPVGVAQAAVQAVEAKQSQAQFAKEQGLPQTVTNSIGMKLQLIPPGEFQMGSDAERAKFLALAFGEDTAKGETPQHAVRITRGFYMGVYEVSQELFEQELGFNPSWEPKVPEAPVGMVTWYNAVNFCNKLSERESLLPCYEITGENIRRLPDRGGYRLPTEAEWEYAARGGTNTTWHFADSASEMDEYAYRGVEFDDRPQTCGQKLPNPFGLCDMYGNVLEWCQDNYSEAAYADSPAEDPQGPATGDLRVVRGGHLFHPTEEMRSAQRKGHRPEVTYPFGGFRVVRSAQPVTE